MTNITCNISIITRDIFKQPTLCFPSYLAVNFSPAVCDWNSGA